MLLIPFLYYMSRTLSRWICSNAVSLWNRSNLISPAIIFILTTQERTSGSKTLYWVTFSSNSSSQASLIFLVQLLYNSHSISCGRCIRKYWIKHYDLNHQRSWHFVCGVIPDITVLNWGWHSPGSVTSISGHGFGLRWQNRRNSKIQEDC